MSLIKKNSNRIDTKNRDSFSQRFNNDIAQYLLQYLPLEDKLRLECVCQQFKNTIFLRQFVMKSNFISRIMLNSSANESYSVFNKVLKKCTNLKSFNDPGFILYKNNDNFVTKMLCEFYSKNNVKYFDVTDIWPYGQTFRPNFVDNQQIDCQLFRTAKVQRLEEGLEYTSDYLITIAQQSGANLKYLSVNLFAYDYSQLNKVLVIISSLMNLIQLKINSQFALNDINLRDSFDKILNNCNKLKHIDIVWSIDRIDSNFHDILSPLLKLKELRQLSLQIKTNHRYKKYADKTFHDSEDFTFKLFNGFAHITHLSLALPIAGYSETIFSDIDVYLPSLQRLELKNRISATNRLVLILSKLSKIQTFILDLSINCNIYSDTKNEIEKLTTKCKKLEDIGLIKLHRNNYSNNEDYYKLFD